MTTPDIQIENHGSICLATPMTAKAHQWVEENVAMESWQWIGGSLAIEPRCVATIVEGMREAELDVILN